MNISIKFSALPALIVSIILALGSGSEVMVQQSTVIAWGSNGVGQTTVPSGLSGVIAIAAHSLALKSDGTVIAWGLND